MGDPGPRPARTADHRGTGTPGRPEESRALARTRKIALENEDGKWEYAVNVHQRTGKGIVTHEVMVGATSGKIKSEEVTTPAEEAREKAAEPKAAHSRSHPAK